MHEMDGLRFNRYHELGQYAFGPKLGLWLVVPFQIIVMTGLGACFRRWPHRCCPLRRPSPRPSPRLPQTAALARVALARVAGMM